MHGLVVRPALIRLVVHYALVIFILNGLVFTDKPLRQPAIGEPEMPDSVQGELIRATHALAAVAERPATPAAIASMRARLAQIEAILRAHS